MQEDQRPIASQKHNIMEEQYQGYDDGNATAVQETRANDLTHDAHPIQVSMGGDDHYQAHQQSNFQPGASQDTMHLNGAESNIYDQQQLPAQNTLLDNGSPIPTIGVQTEKDESNFWNAMNQNEMFKKDKGAQGLGQSKAGRSNSFSDFDNFASNRLGKENPVDKQFNRTLST